jgi:hypothetical protein
MSAALWFLAGFIVGVFGYPAAMAIIDQRRKGRR